MSGGETTIPPSQTSLSSSVNASSNYKNAARLRKMAPSTSRSGNYERLEGGIGVSRMGGRRFGWKKFAIGAVVAVSLLFFFAPRQTRYLPEWSGSDEPVSADPPHDDDVEVNPLPHAPPSTVRPPHVDESPIPTFRPTSPATDPDPLKTVHCTASYNSDDRVVQYALMIDAGSTGSRIHIYKFNNCGPSATYEYEVFKQTQPGLSSYKGRPQEAAESLDVLLEEAMQVVPGSLRSCTPVAVKATAGLRLLGPSDSADILDAVLRRLQTSYPFPVDEQEGVIIMDGKDEGVYAWITANYLLDTIRADTPPGTLPYAVLDLGGASTQIVFEPTFDKSKPDSTLEEGEHKYTLKFGGKDYVLYQHSYLGYGLMRARKSVHTLVDFMSTLRPSYKSGEIVANPCLARGMQRVVEIEDESGARNVNMSGEQIGGYEACNRIVELVMAKDSICEVKPCSFDGVYQPSLMETFPRGKILLLSYFYDRVKPLLPKDADSFLSVSTLATLARDVCLGREEWRRHWGTDPEAMEELEGRPEYCLDLTFMHSLLRLGYEFDDDRDITIGKKIDDTELGWCLGATIAMVGGELRCRV